MIDQETEIRLGGMASEIHHLTAGQMAMSNTLNIVVQDVRELRRDMAGMSHAIVELVGAIDGKFSAVDERFNAMDERFNAVDERFNAVDERFNAVDERFNAVDERFNAVEAKIDAMDAKFDALKEAVIAEIRSIRG